MNIHLRKFSKKSSPLSNIYRNFATNVAKLLRLGKKEFILLFCSRLSVTLRKVINTNQMERKLLNRIKVVLAEKNMTNKYLAELLGKDPAVVSKWVTNTNQPNLETIIQIAKVLNVSVDELIRTE